MHFYILSPVTNLLHLALGQLPSSPVHDADESIEEHKARLVAKGYA